MKLRSLVGSAAARWNNLRRRALVVASASALACGLVFGGLNADVIDFEDFEGLTMVPFDVATATGDDTDWTNNIPGWTIDNSGMSSVSTEGAYNGVTAMDVDSWISEQGTQLGRNSSGQLGTAGSRNTALVFDGDAWADFSGGEDNGFNSYISRTYDITGRDAASISISLDYEFASEVTQRGVVEVSFDGGTNWIMLLDLDSATLGNDVILSGPVTFTSGTDFTVSSDSMTVRIGKIAADNNWWFAVDNVQIADTNGVIDLEDFEGLTLEKFTVAADGYQPDGTDYSNDIPNWVIDNSGMALPSAEGAFNGWAALDIESWIGEQGGQGRSSFEFFENNTVLVADPDAWQDYAEGYDSELHSQGFNSYITRTYDISGYARSSISISLWYEFRVEDTQRGVIEVSFDGGTTWQNLLDLDSDGDGEVEGDELEDGSMHLGEPATWAGGTDFNATSNEMMLRIGCLDGGNDWWFAIDEVQIEGDPMGRPAGDANSDGSFDNGDIAPFVQALLNPTGYAESFPGIDVDTVLDMNGDGTFDNGDLASFVAELL